MDLFEILQNDNRVIVASKADERTLITWNRHYTLVMWRCIVRSDDESYPSDKFDPNDWEEVGVRHLVSFSGTMVNNFTLARKMAIDWLDGK